MENQKLKTELNNIQDLEKYVGKEIGITDWFQITQDDINAFAKLTHDEQWIHTDIEKSKKYSPYKTTVAHGFFILSLSIKFIYETFDIKSVKMGVNYGLDRVRFMSPTFSGGYIRALISLLDAEIKAESVKYKMSITFEQKGQNKPVCVAEFLAVGYE
mgnify:FL=1